MAGRPGAACGRVGAPRRSHGARAKERCECDAAARAIDEKIAKPLGLGLAEAAWRIHHLVNLNMANATRAVSLTKGYDPRRFTVVPPHCTATVDNWLNLTVTLDTGEERRS